MLVDWESITRRQAARMIGAASQAEQRLAAKFNADEATEAEWLAAFTLWEDLRVFALTGERPGSAT